MQTLLGVASLALVVAVGGVVSCSTPTSTTHLWQAPDVPSRPPMTRIIVFGGGLTEGGRRTMEDGFVASLVHRGVTAKPSYELFPTMPEEGAARAAVQVAGFDGALVATLRGVKERSAYVPGSAYPYSGLWGGYGSGYYGSPGWTGAPGYIVNDEIVNVETTLWDLRGKDARGTLVWSATTATENPSTAGDAVKSLTKELVPKLASAGLIGAVP